MNECNYHNGDEPLIYINNENCLERFDIKINNENCAFIDSAGIMDVYVNNKHIRIECEFCPKCGEKLR